MIAVSKAIILMLLVSLGNAKPVGTVLGSPINILDFLARLESSSARFTDYLSQMPSKTLFLNPVASKWERSWRENRDRFQVVTCDNAEDLNRALDGGYRISGLDWQAVKKGKDLGIPSKYLGVGYSYVLVKYSLISSGGRLRTASGLSKDVEEAVGRIDTEHPDSILPFINKIGTHYLASYSIGDSFYQIYVYRRDRYKRLQRKLKKANFMNPPNLQKLLSLFYFDYFGPMKTLSGEKSIVEWSDEHFYSPFLLHRYVELQKSPRLFNQFRSKLESSSTFLTLELKTLEHLIHDENKKMTFHEVLNNQMKLYETNL